MKFGPDITIPETVNGCGIQELDVWVEVSPTDQDGITIAGIKKGDRVIIEDASGICSFAKTKLDSVAGIVAIANGVLQDGANYYAGDKAEETQEAFNEQRKVLQELLTKDVKHKRRDAFGLDPGTGDYGKNEGGLIVCMPSAKGAIYATPEHRLGGGAKSNGRLPEYVASVIKDEWNSFFPCRLEGGVTDCVAIDDGAVHILAFDQKFSDNAGTYSVNVRVERPA